MGARRLQKPTYKRARRCILASFATTNTLTMGRLAARRSDSVDSGPGIVRAASQDTNPFYDRSTSVASSSAQSGRWSRTPTVVPIPGQKPSRTQKRALKRKNKALEKEKEREAKKESYQLPMIKEEGALPGPPTEGRFKDQKGDRFERCYPVRTSVARCTWHTYRHPLHDRATRIGIRSGSRVRFL